MCIIGFSTTGERFPDATVEHCWSMHKDGAGVMYVHDGALVIDKGHMELEGLKAALAKVPEGTSHAFHCRSASHGSVCAKNTHPFVIGRTKADGVVAAAMHNGVFFGLGVEKDNPLDCTDTEMFIKQFLRGLPVAFLTNRAIRALIGEAVGVNRMLVMDKWGHTLLAGEWKESGAFRYSNAGWEPYVAPLTAGFAHGGNWRDRDLDLEGLEGYDYRGLTSGERDALKRRRERAGVTDASAVRCGLCKKMCFLTDYIYPAHPKLPSGLYCATCQTQLRFASDPFVSGMSPRCYLCDTLLVREDRLCTMRRADIMCVACDAWVREPKAKIPAKMRAFLQNSIMRSRMRIAMKLVGKEPASSAAEEPQLPMAVPPPPELPVDSPATGDHVIGPVDERMEA